jgi:hypothetical protein
MLGTWKNQLDQNSEDHTEKTQNKIGGYCQILQWSRCWWHSTGGLAFTRSLVPPMPLLPQCQQRLCPVVLVVVWRLLACYWLVLC